MVRAIYRIYHKTTHETVEIGFTFDYKIKLSAFGLLGLDDYMFTFEKVFDRTDRLCGVRESINEMYKAYQIFDDHNNDYLFEEKIVCTLTSENEKDETPLSTDECNNNNDDCTEIR